MDNDDYIDVSHIPDGPPVSQWALGPPTLVTSIEQLKEMFVPKITKQSLINQLYIELMDRSSRNQPARIMAAKLIADLNGWTTLTADPVIEDTSNITPEEAKRVHDEFEKSY